MDETLAVLLAQLKDSAVQLAFVLGTILLLGWLAKAQPTALTFVLILTPVPLWGLTLFSPWLKWVLPFYTPLLMLILLVDGFFLSVSAKHLEFSRALSHKLSIGQKSPVILTVVNNSPDRVQGTIRDSVPAGLSQGKVLSTFTFSIGVEPFAHQQVSYEVLPEKRGVFRFEKVHFRYRSRLGLLWLMVQGARPESIQVTPDLRRVRQMRIKASKAQNAGELQKRALGLEGTQFSSLRHYLPGDDIRKMAWQATAKLDLPMIRTFTHEVEQPILVLLDAGRKMETLFQDQAGKRLQKYDWALNTALAFMAVAIDRGDCVGLGIFSNKVLAQIQLGSGRKHLSKILEMLGETEVQPVEPDYEAVMLQFARSLKRRSLIVMLTDLVDPVASHSLLHSLKSFSNNHLLMVVTLADSETLHEATGFPETAYDVYRKGVALDLLEMRRQTLLTLSKNNHIMVVDAPPSGLDEALIQRYLQLKQRSQF